LGYSNPRRIIRIHASSGDSRPQFACLKGFCALLSCYDSAVSRVISNRSGNKATFRDQSYRINSAMQCEVTESILDAIILVPRSLLRIPVVCGYSKRASCKRRRTFIHFRRTVRGNAFAFQWASVLP